MFSFHTSFIGVYVSLQYVSNNGIKPNWENLDPLKFLSIPVSSPYPSPPSSSNPPSKIVGKDLQIELIVSRKKKQAS